MAKLYVANCTKQKHEFLYNPPEQKGHIKEPIDSGRQEVIWKKDGSATLDELMLIVEQHSIYGMVNVRDIDRTKRFTHFCYSIDKPINIEKIMYTVEANDAFLEAQSLDLRKETASMISHSLSTVAAQQDNALTHMEIEVKELAPAGKEARVDETIVIEQGRNSQRGRGHPRNN
jgi:hypothetical protein